jgi:hypothetical protein
VQGALRCAATPAHLHGGCLQITAWVELLAVQLVTPNASLIGHLAGVLAGAHPFFSLFLGSFLKALYWRRHQGSGHRFHAAAGIEAAHRVLALRA